MHTWQWHTWQDYAYLTCSLLQDWHHGFFTRQFSPQMPEDLVALLDPEARAYRVKQVHGDQVLNAAHLEPIALVPAANSEGKAVHPSTDLLEAVGKSDAASSAVLAEADGLYTNQSQQALWVCTADCTPVLIGDRVSGRIAAIHAGWRGTASAIVPKAIAHLQAQGSDLADLQIAMGPAISGEVYQVSTTVAAQVGATILDGASISMEKEPETVLEPLSRLPDSPIIPDPQPGRAKLDVRKVNKLQLLQMGIQPTQISIAPYCTYQNPELFFSYRREHLKQVQWAGIVR
jgi:polyphenol oxidase